MKEAIKIYDIQEFYQRLANISAETRFARVVEIRTETDMKKIAEFTPDERQIYYDWRNYTMTEEERRQEDIKNAENVIALLKLNK